MVGIAADPTAVDKVKTQAEEALKTAAITKVTKAETTNLLIYASYPDAKLKPLGELAEKSFALAAKQIKVEKPDELFKGKLAIFLIPDRRQYANLCLAFTGKRPDQAELYEVRARGDLPFAAIGQPLGEKYTETDWQMQSMAWVASAVLNKKLNTDPGAFDLPEWAELGFGRITALKAENNTVRLTTFRTKTKALITGKLRGPTKINDVWNGSKGKEFDVLAASVVEYLAYGADADPFVKLMNGFKKSDSNPNPTIQNVLQGLELKWDDMDTAWKTFALKTK
jgi:hypothetical protein